MNKNKTLLVFDYDGTIHRTLDIYELAFRHAHQYLIDQGIVEDEVIERDRIAGWLGLNATEMWNDFKPDMAEGYKQLGSTLVGEEMEEAVRTGHANWYPGAKETLDSLKEAGYRMVILSNCKGYYRDAHWEAFDLGRWFERFYDCESYDFAPKTEIIKSVLRDYEGEEIEKVVVIGDRSNDMACARSIGAPFIGCGYGYGREGELDGADVVIEDVAAMGTVLITRTCVLWPE